MNACLFIDFDNTMMATEQYAVPTLVARFNRLYGGQIAAPLTVNDFHQNFHGLAREGLCTRMAEHFGITVDCALLYAGREWEMMQALQQIPGGILMAPHLIETLTLLRRDHGIKAALVSNNPVQRALAAMRYASNHDGDQLAALLGTRFFEADERQKPLPDVYARAVVQTGADLSRSCAVEDSVNGVLSAQAAGLKVIGFTGFSTAPEDSAAKLRAAGCIAIVSDWDMMPAALRDIGVID